MARQAPKSYRRLSGSSLKREEDGIFHRPNHGGWRMRFMISWFRGNEDRCIEVYEIRDKGLYRALAG